jgi:hypothetical protein
MAKQRITKRKRSKAMQATRQVAAFLTLTIAQETDDGDVLLSHLPLPYAVAALTWLATAWLALWPAVVRLQMEAGWLAGDAMRWLGTLAGAVSSIAGPLWSAVGAMEMLTMRFYLAFSVAEALVRALWWAVVR